MQAISHLTRQSFSLLVIKYILEVILLDFKFAIIESVIYQKLAELTQVYLEAVMLQRCTSKTDGPDLGILEQMKSKVILLIF